MADWYKFGVNDAQIAPWTSSGVYGTLVDLIAINQIQFRFTAVNAELQGDDVIVDTFEKFTGVTGTVRFGEGAQHQNVLNVLLGVSPTSSNSRVRLYAGSQNAPFFGLAWKVLHTDGSGAETHYMINKCKLTGDFTYSFAYGGYSIPEFNFRGVPDSTFDALTRIFNPTSTALAMPLTY